jgi:hypothetical protein
LVEIWAALSFFPSANFKKKRTLKCLKVLLLSAQAFDDNLTMDQVACYFFTCITVYPTQKAPDFHTCSINKQAMNFVLKCINYQKIHYNFKASLKYLIS